MVSPSLVVLLLVTSLPFIALVAMSLANIKLTGDSTGFAGLGNYLQMLRDGRFLHSLAITVVYTVATVLLQLVVGLALALALFRLGRGQRVLTVAVVLPMILAPVVVGLAWKTFLLTPKYGLVDYIAQLAGLGSQPWLADPTLALVSVTVVHTWQWTPFAFLVFLASLHSLPPDPMEAARVDGANAWQIFRHLILPMLAPAIVIVAILRMVWALRAFDAILALTGGGPGTATEILNLYIYEVAFSNLDLSYAAAMAVVLLLGTAVVSWLLFRGQRSAR